MAEPSVSRSVCVQMDTCWSRMPSMSTGWCKYLGWGRGSGVQGGPGIMGRAAPELQSQTHCGLASLPWSQPLVSASESVRGCMTHEPVAGDRCRRKAGHGPGLFLPASLSP